MTTTATLVPLRRFEYRNQAKNSYKFWEVEATIVNPTVVGQRAHIIVRTHWGRIGGGSGQSKEYIYNWDKDAYDFIDSKIKEKLTKGYYETTRVSAPVRRPVIHAPQTTGTSKAVVADEVLDGLRALKDNPPAAFASWWNDLKPYWVSGGFADPEAIPMDLLTTILKEIKIELTAREEESESEIDESESEIDESESEIDESESEIDKPLQSLLDQIRASVRG